jgi:hypothetical protein
MSLFRGPGLSAGLRSLLVLGALTGCSLVNAPDEIDPGPATGGAGGAGGSGAAGGAGGAGGSGGGGGGVPACDEPIDCASFTTECATGECVGGQCVATPAAEGTACGVTTPTGSCDVADSCDGMGQCVNRAVEDGTYCEDCPEGPGKCGLCSQGTCPSCPARATRKSFRSPFALGGWALTGGWRVYDAAPPQATFVPQCGDNFDNDQDGLIDSADPDCVGANDRYEGPSGPIQFQRPVLGTDGNRVPAYIPGGSELEVSSATSPKTVLPNVLQFKSWHVDEGHAYDLKAIQVSEDGQSFTTVAICQQCMGQSCPVDYAFCEPSSPAVARAADDWDLIQVPIPAALVGKLAHVRFVYNTTDGCCGWERGWFVDELNVAEDCACAGASECGYLDGTCSTGACETATKECVPSAQNVGSTCESAASSDCSAPTCDSGGLCDSNSFEFEGGPCSTCSEGPGLCRGCTLGSCENCDPIQTFNGTFSSAAWTTTGDWSLDSCLRPNSVTPNSFSCFDSPMSSDEPKKAPVFGSSGSRTNVSPWTAMAKEVSVSNARSPASVLPANLEFHSWHQDRGGNNTFNLKDRKSIRVSIDNGMTWTTLVDCDGNMVQPFCQPSPPNTNRPLANWDNVSIPIPANLVGQPGIVEFNYNTVDAGEGWERGWYIDDVNLDRCN